MSKTVHQIKVGDNAFQQKTITERDLELFGEVSNDYNKAHFDSEYASKTMFKKRIAHGMLVGSLFSKVFGMELPGEGAIYVSQNLRFKRPVYIGDEITATVIVKEVNVEKNRVTFDCVATNQLDEPVIKGEAVLMPIKNQ